MAKLTLERKSISRGPLPCQEPAQPHLLTREDGLSPRRTLHDRTAGQRRQHHCGHHLIHLHCIRLPVFKRVGSMLTSWAWLVHKAHRLSYHICLLSRDHLTLLCCPLISAPPPKKQPAQWKLKQQSVKSACFEWCFNQPRMSRWGPCLHWGRHLRQGRSPQTLLLTLQLKMGHFIWGQREQSKW